MIRPFLVCNVTNYSEEKTPSAPAVSVIVVSGYAAGGGKGWADATKTLQAPGCARSVGSNSRCEVHETIAAMILFHVASRSVFQPEKMAKTDLATGDSLFAGLNCFEPGQEHAPHTHAGQDKLYFVLEGSGEVTVGEERGSIARGDLVLARAGEEHSLRNPGPERLVVMVIMAPPRKG
jgi:mannose-6-phosphate isomerase-like protein (cupin superfamily)